MSNLNLSLGDLRGKLGAAFPKILIGLLLLVNIGAGILLLRSPLSEHSQLTSTQKTHQTALDKARSERQGESDTLQIQVDNSQKRLDETADTLLSAAEADSILNHIYSYASSSEVEITNLQLQPPAADAPASDLYAEHVFKLQIEGTFAQLVVFLTLFREASVPGVNLNNLSVTVDGERDLLTVDMLLYTSPYSAGQVLASLPAATLPAPMPTPMPTATVLPPTPTLTPAAPVETATSQPTATFTGTVLGPGTYDDSSPALQYTAGTWETMESQSGFSGTYHYSSDPIAEVQFSFIGTAIGIQYIGYKNFGTFEIYVDGQLWGEVDGYAPDGTFGQVTYISGLDYTAHSVTIRNTSRRNEASEGNIIALDALYVLQSNQTAP